MSIQYGDFNFFPLFFYFLIISVNNVKTEVLSRIQQAKKVYYRLEKVLKSKVLSNNLKLNMYMTLLRLIVPYSWKMWALRKTEKLRQMIFEKKVLRKMYGLVFDS